MNAADKSTVQNSDVPFAMYDAFTDTPYSGSQAAIVLHASGIPRQTRARIARELGTPATAFVDSIHGQNIKVQFFSTVMELPMCGHGSVCLVTRLVELGLLSDYAHDTGDHWQSATLDLPKGKATVEYLKTDNNRIEIMLEVVAAQFTSAEIDQAELMHIMGVDQSAISDNLPVEVASADFIHLCLPLRNLEVMQQMKPDFTALTDYCKAHGLDTVAAFSTETTDHLHDVHVRDFCPAVGVAESAAAGTTNAALATYLLRNGCVVPDSTGNVIVRARQGIEIDRPSQVTTRIQTKGSQIERLQVGGVASRVFEGLLNIAFETS